MGGGLHGEPPRGREQRGKAVEVILVVTPLLRHDGARPGARTAVHVRSKMGQNHLSSKNTPLVSPWTMAPSNPSVVTVRSSHNLGNADRVPPSRPRALRRAVVPILPGRRGDQPGVLRRCVPCVAPRGPTIPRPAGCVQHQHAPRCPSRRTPQEAREPCLSSLTDCQRRRIQCAGAWPDC